MLEQTNGTDFGGVNIKTQKRSFNLEIMFCGFQKRKNTMGKFKKRWFGPLRV